jgi:hypothetical protein
MMVCSVWCSRVPNIDAHNKESLREFLGAATPPVAPAHRTLWCSQKYFRFPFADGSTASGPFDESM